MKLLGKKFLLILLFSPEEGEETNISIAGRTRLMKMGFLFDKEVKSIFNRDKTFEEIELPEYFAWHYGPFSVDLLKDLEFLINQGFINVEISGNLPLAAEVAEYEYWIEDMGEFETREYDEEIFELTDEKGINKAKEIWAVLSENQKKLLIDFKRVLNNTRLDRILEYVYRKYSKDGYIDKSIIRERYLY
ncbi:MAG: hypothetical protein HQ591_06000 [candidate division Zixibacteria bacterium]|nr:hypothetical protein [Candidatus Tariuqbacter arcticus]